MAWIEAQNQGATVYSRNNFPDSEQSLAVQNAKKQQELLDSLKRGKIPFSTSGKIAGASIAPSNKTVVTNTAQGRGVQSTGIVSRGGSNNSKNTSKNNANKAEEQRRKDAEKAYKKMMGQKISGIESAYGSNRSIIENLMASLNPKYQSTQDEYKRTMDENQQKDVNALASLTAAYGTSDSEQRMQMQERKQNEYGKNFSQFVDSLNKEKATEQQTYQNRLLELLATAEQAKANVKADATIGLQDWNDKFNAQSDQAKQQEFENNLRLQSAANSGSRIGVENTAANPKQSSFIARANQLKTQFNGAWDQIANVLQSEGYDIANDPEQASWLDSVMTGRPVSISSGMNDFGSTDLSKLSDEDFFNLYSQYNR